MIDINRGRIPMTSKAYGKAVVSCMKAGLVSVCFILLSGSVLAAPFAYIANSGSDNVSVIDVATNMVIATVAVGDAPRGVAANVQGTRVYVANRADDTVSVIDATTNAVLTTVPVGAAHTGWPSIRQGLGYMWRIIPVITSR